MCPIEAAIVESVFKARALFGADEFEAGKNPASCISFSLLAVKGTLTVLATCRQEAAADEGTLRRTLMPEMTELIWSGGYTNRIHNFIGTLVTQGCPYGPRYKETYYLRPTVRPECIKTPVREIPNQALAQIVCTHFPLNPDQLSMWWAGTGIDLTNPLSPFRQILDEEYHRLAADHYDKFLQQGATSRA